MVDALKNGFGLDPSDIDNSHIPFRLVTSIKNKELLFKELNKKNIKCEELHYMAISKGMYYAKDLINVENNVENKKFDFCYYGAFKPKRIKEVQYFCNDKNCYLFGSNFDKWNCEKAVLNSFPRRKSMKFTIEQINKCYASIILGATEFSGTGHLPSRLIEASIAKTVSFVNINFDGLFNNDFYYVSSKEELFEKINLIKNNNELYQKCLKEQLDWIENYPVFNNAIHDGGF